MTPRGEGKKEESSSGFVELRCPAIKEKRSIQKSVNTYETTEHGKELRPKIIAIPML